MNWLRSEIHRDGSRQHGKHWQGERQRSQEGQEGQEGHLQGQDLQLGNAKAKGVRLKVEGRGVSFNTSVGKIAAKKTKTVKVKLKAKKPGKVKVTFKVTSKNAGGKSVKKKIKVKK